MMCADIPQVHKRMKEGRKESRLEPVPLRDSLHFTFAHIVIESRDGAKGGDLTSHPDRQIGIFKVLILEMRDEEFA